MLKKTLTFIFKILIFIPLLSGLVFVTFPFGYAQDFSFSPKGDSAVLNRWVDSVFRTMTPDERLGQLFMAELSSKWTENDSRFKSIETLVKNYHIGGVIFFYGGPVRQALLTNKLQSEAKIPLMVAQDGEWGLSMRLDSTVVFPRNLCLGAIESNEIIYELGREIGRQCNRLGVNIDFMPCVDVYDNLSNTVITNRSFGSNITNVAQKGAAITAGMSDFKILTTAKHFPGHGNTDVDSHEALPVISDSREKIDTTALYPFKYLINSGTGGVMVGHLFVPAFDSGKEKTPSSISKNIINELLINKLNFNGLVFTDALQMKGVSANYPGGELEIRAFEAGVDVFLMPSDCKKSFQAMKSAVQSGRISQTEIDRRCKKILLAKKRMGLDKFQPVNTANLYNDLNTFEAKFLVRKIYENAITLIKNDADILPLRDVSAKKIAAVSVSKEGTETEFEKTLKQFGEVSIFSVSKNAETKNFDTIVSKLQDFDIVIVGLHDLNPYPKKFGLTDNTVNFINKIAGKQNVVLNVLNSPLAVNKFVNYKKLSAITVSYDDTWQARTVSAQMIFGALPFLGKLPVYVNDDFKEGLSIVTESFRL
jgi:beta-glucosidase-like glycosyl hydrolase